MTYKQNITAILECFFTGFKEEIIDSACNRILEQEPCEVSEYDKDHIWYKGHQYISLRRFLEVKAEAEQEPKTGHWSRKTKVDAYDIAGVKTWGIKCQCDRCDFTTIVVEDFGYYKFCPNCGARMVEPQERSCRND